MTVAMRAGVATVKDSSKQKGHVQTTIAIQIVVNVYASHAELTRGAGLVSVIAAVLLIVLARVLQDNVKKQVRRYCLQMVWAMTGKLAKAAVDSLLGGTVGGCRLEMMFCKHLMKCKELSWVL
jgi:hypothetical protein